MSALKRTEFSATEFAKLIGVSVQTLTNWVVDRGMPAPDKPAKNIAYYDLRVHLPWVRDNIWLPNNTAKARKLEAETQLKEMERDEAAGTLVRADLALREWEDLLARMRTNIRGLPARLVPLLEEVQTTRERMEITSQQIDLILQSLVETES